uniref:rRNA N-glycosidase n=1 Tax=Oryza barthii TaxID=65489 RepID=A0A0D3GW84_9ORYZ
MAAADPPQGPPVRLNIDKLFCPRQDGIQDIHVHEWDIAGGLRSYLEMLKAMKRRQINIAPFTVGGRDLHIPVTPLENPKNGFSSHFIIRIVNSEDPRYSVDCLIRDTDLYFMAFRRRLVLTLEEEETLAEEIKRQEEAAESSSSKSKKHKSQKGMRKVGWGTWYSFKVTDVGMRVPDFLEAVYCGITNGYDNNDLLTPGSLTDLYDMLLTLGKFEDNPVPSQSFQRACYRVMTTICEPCRLRTMLKEIVNRFRYNLSGYTLSKSLMDDMRSWTQLGAVALDWHNRGDSSFQLPDWCSKIHNVNNMEELIGKNGMVLLIRADEAKMDGLSEEEIDAISNKAKGRKNGPADRLDIGFPPPPQPPPPPAAS